MRGSEGEKVKGECVCLAWVRVFWASNVTLYIFDVLFEMSFMSVSYREVEI